MKAINRALVKRFTAKTDMPDALTTVALSRAVARWFERAPVLTASFFSGCTPG